MKMKRYFAPDARQAMRELREQQGPDAVILSNRRVNGGVEIIAAMDYEDAITNSALGNPGSVTAPASGERTESPAMMQSMQQKSGAADSQDRAADPSLMRIQNELKGLRSIMEAPMLQMAWGEQTRIKPMHAKLLRKLMMLGLSPRLCSSITEQIADRGINSHSWLDALKLLADLVPVSGYDIDREGGVITLVGPTGVGKTTTIAKLAARFALRHGRRHVSLVTTDSYRVGAHEHLRTYGRILGIPVKVASDTEELRQVLDADAHRGLTLIDTAGASQHDMRLIDQLSALDLEDIPRRNYLVMSATSQINMLDSVIRSFSKINLQGCILTKTDEATSLGEALSIIIQHDLPLAYVSNGQKVPDNLTQARGKMLVRDAVKLMQKTQHTPTEEELAYTFGGIHNHAVA